MAVITLTTVLLISHLRLTCPKQPRRLQTLQIIVVHALNKQSTWLYHLITVYRLFLIGNVLRADYRILEKYNEREKKRKLRNGTTGLNEPWSPFWRISFGAIRGVNTDAVQIRVDDLFPAFFTYYSIVSTSPFH